MKQFLKQSVSFLLICCLFMTNSLALQSTATQATVDDGQLTLLDSLVDTHYEIAVYSDGANIYTITRLENGGMELAYAPIGGEVRTLNFNESALMSNTTNSINTVERLNDISFVESVLAYGREHANQSELVNVTVASSSVPQITPFAYNDVSYNALMDQLEEIHGPQHDYYNWAGMASQTVNGIKYEYKEMLFYDMRYRDTVAYTQGMTLGSIVTALLAAIPGLEFTLSAVSIALGILGYYTTELDRNGQLSAYFGQAVYNRFVFINDGSVMYCPTSKDIRYNGWVDDGFAYRATLEETGTLYSPTQDIFDSYIEQRRIALDQYLS